MKAADLKLRRRLLWAAAFLGAALFAVAVVTGATLYAAFGLGSWLVLAITILLGLRFRLAQLMAAVMQLTSNAETQQKAETKHKGDLRNSLELAFDELARLRKQIERRRDEEVRDRRFRLRVHEKLALNERAAIARSSALAGVLSKVEAHQGRLETALTTLRRSTVDSQVLSLRAFQDIDELIVKLDAKQIKSESALQELRRSTIDSQTLTLRAFQDLGEASGSLEIRQTELKEVVRDMRRSLVDSQALTLRAFQDLGEAASRLHSAQVEAEAVLCDMRRSAVDSQTLTLRAFQSFEEVTSKLEAKQEAIAQQTRLDLQNVTSLLAGKHEQLRPSLENVLVPMHEELGVLHAEVTQALQAHARLLGSDKELRQLFRRGADWLRYETAHEMGALQALNSLHLFERPVPLLGGWALDPTLMLELVQHILAARPECVVECGSGVSTVWIAAALKRAGRGKLIALEHDPVYVSKGRELLDEHGLSDVAAVVNAPLETIEVDGRSWSWYSAAATGSLPEIDLLLVDGPPGNTGPMARYPALPVLAPQLRDGAVVAIDDFQRKDEKKMLGRWRKNHTQLGEPRILTTYAALCEWRKKKGAAERRSS